MNNKKLKYIIPSFFILILMYACIYLFYENHKKIHISETGIMLEKTSNDFSILFRSEMDSIKIFIETTGDFILATTTKSNDELNAEVATQIKGTFNKIINKSMTLQNLYYIDNKTGGGIDYKGIINPGDKKADLRTRPWYTQAIVQYSPIITEVYADIDTGKPVITVSYALKKDNKLIGVIAADLFLEDLYNIYSIITKTENTITYITDAHGNIILHPEKDILGFSLANPQDEYISKYNVNKKNIINTYNKLWNENLSRYESGEIDYSNIFGKEVHGYYTKIPDLNWRIVSLVDTELMNKTFSDYLFILLLAGIVVSIIIIFYMYFILSSAHYKDILTGVSNKNKLLDILHKNSQNNKESLLLYIDINNFSSVNSTYGSAIGDKVLKEFTLILAHHLSLMGTLIHYKADDFIFLFKTEDWDYALEITKEHHNYFNNLTMKIEDHTLSLSTFMGLIKLDKRQLKDVENSLLLAEDILNDLKQLDKEALLSFNNFDDMLEIKEEKTKKKTMLLRAIDEDRIIPFFQPIYNIKKGTVCKYEVLMRIKSGEEYLSPFPFIQIAEENNLIETVDLIVLEKALAYKNIADPNDNIQFSFNISGKVLNDDEYLIKVVDIMRSYNIKAENIVLEITETQSIENLDRLASIMHTYKKLGIKFSIDDFGTAFSSIQYLKQIPADYIKIDGSFIRDINDKKENFYLVQSILNMSKAFKMKTIAEFVENEQILDTISKVGIDYAQGYFVGKPKESIN
jgi:diguanylate cyclase (GGDEF)-like protein